MQNISKIKALFFLSIIFILLLNLGCAKKISNTKTITKEIKTEIETDIQLPKDENRISQIVYRNAGPAAPPEYNKTFTITIDRDNELLELDSLKTRDINISKKVTEKQFVELLSLFEKLNVSAIPMDEFDGCVGGSAESLKLFKNEEEVFSGIYSSCGGESSTNMRGDYIDFIATILQLAFD